MACASGPQPIKIGKEACAFCKMTISDSRFGAELITNKGKIFVFDDPSCLVSFLHDSQNKINKSEIKASYLTDFIVPHNLILAENAYIIKSESISAPMNGTWVAFSNKDSAESFLIKQTGKFEKWNDVIQ